MSEHVVVGVDFGSSFISVTVVVSNSEGRTTFHIKNWENAPCTEQQPGNEKSEVPAIGFIHDGKLGHGYIPTDDSVLAENIIRGWKSYFDKDGDKMWGAFKEKLDKNKLKPEDFIESLSEYVWNHTRTQMENKGILVDRITKLVFTIPPSFEKCQEDFIKIFSKSWPLDTEGIIMRESEAVGHCVFWENKNLQAASLKPAGVNIAQVDSGGLIMGIEGTNVSSFEFPSGLVHVVFREISDPKSVKSGSEYVRLKFMEHTPRSYDAMYLISLNRPQGHITYGGVKVLESEVAKWRSEAYDSGIEFFNNSLSKLEVPIDFIVMSGGSFNSPYFQNGIDNHIKNAFKDKSIPLQLRPINRANANSEGAARASMTLTPTQAHEVLTHSQFGILAIYTKRKRLKQGKPITEDQETLFTLKNMGDEFRTISGKTFDFTLEFPDSSNEEGIANSIGALGIIPGYVPLIKAVVRREGLWDSVPDCHFSKHGIEMDMINLRIPPNECENLAADIIKDKPLCFNYSVRFDIKESHELDLSVDSGGRNLCIINLQLAISFGSGRLILAPWVETDPTTIPLYLEKKYAGMSGAPVQNKKRKLSQKTYTIQAKKIESWLDPISRT